ncbi:MAG: hypothetical protein EAZ71_11750 [Verrucomicrobia bacterium]|nr:MAG: hypothetical protein EAZ82_10975 [Verrucomicrobiota bacterium]TAF24237.1 MAG: hypothetical protein EAZ71_11750 [Verrucomicrobiota bacterium]
MVLEGREAVEAALAAWWDVVGMMVAEEQAWEVPVWSGLEVLRCGEVELSEWGDPARHCGVLGLARLPAERAEVADFALGLEPEALLVVCPRTMDAEFAGRLIGLAAERGAAGVLFGAEGVSPFGSDVVAASAGGIFRVPVRVADGGQLLRSLKAARVRLVACEAEGSQGPRVARTGRRALVAGDPVLGLGAFWRAACDERVVGDVLEGFECLAALDSKPELEAQGFE